MQLDTPQILSIVALISALGSVAWIKILSARSFKGIDDKIKFIEGMFAGINSKLAKLADENRVCSENVIRVQEHEKTTDQSQAQLRNELTREVQLITQHIDAIHSKITYIDDKLEKIRDRGL